MKRSKLFEKCLRESREPIPSPQKNPDSEEAYYIRECIDDQDVDVFIEDRNKTVIFVWDRRKSNDNIVDPRPGKGFSFYLARHVFEDENYIFFSREKPRENEVVGIIPGDKNIMTVARIIIEREKRIRIISASYVDEDSPQGIAYAENKWMRSLHGKSKRKIENDEEIEERRKIIEEHKKRLGEVRKFPS